MNSSSVQAHDAVTRAPTAPPETTTADPDAERLRRFGEAIEAIRRRVEAEVGAEDVAYFRRLDRFSKRMEIAGRLLIHFSFEPVGFFSGVFALWLHKQLQLEEIGHAVLHGVFDHLPDAKEYHTNAYVWDAPADERSWQYAHVMRHHPNPNVVGKDDNIHFGFMRISEHTPWRWYHRFQVPSTIFLLSPNLGWLTGVRVTGLSDVLIGNGRPEKFDFIKDRSLATISDCVKKTMRKFVPYYAKNFVFYPMLAGPFFPKVLFGNWLAETMRDSWLAATIYTGHIADTAVYPEGTRAKSRGAYYAMQVEATNNFAASLPVSILSGGLDCHIEHHLFPKLPPNRLRKITGEVQAVCEAHGVRYRRDPSFWKGLKRAFARIKELSFDTQKAASPA